jgi:DNA-binding response OmpR family regulator
MKVSIIDPDWRFATQATAYLESHAHLVVHLAEPDLALRHAAHWKPDLVVLAAEFAEQGILGLMPAISPMPAVLLTEHMDRYDRAWRAWQKGGDELLMKPVFHSDELHEAVVAALENAAAGPRTRKGPTSMSASA